jgi:hypothetical protein
LFVLGVCANCHGVDVLVLASGNGNFDPQLIAALEGAGHVVTLGPPFHELDADDVIGGCDVVYLQANYNWAFGDMPVEGQQKLLDFLALGGGVVTCEWLMWKVGDPMQLQVLEPVLPSTSDGTYAETLMTTYTQVTPDAVLNEGVREKFTFANQNIGGSETYLTPKAGATVFYASDQVGIGVVGWDVGAGRVISFSSVAGALSVQNEDFARLLANAMTWAAGEGEEICIADCNDDLQLNILDFVCFQGLFQSGDDAADINGDGALNILDFVAFQGAFVEGCI